MFLLGLGRRSQELEVGRDGGVGQKQVRGGKEERNNSLKSGEVHPNRSLVRSCSSCGVFFKIVDDSENASGDFEKRGGADNHSSGASNNRLQEYIISQGQDPENFEDFILQFMEISLEDDWEVFQNKGIIDESICGDCLDAFVSKYSLIVDKETARMSKFAQFSDLVLSSTQEPEENSTENSHLQVDEAHGDFLRLKEVRDRQIQKKIAIGDMKIINTIEMDEVINLRRNQNYELNLKEELSQCESKFQGVKKHGTLLRQYLERLQKTDFLNLSFYIDQSDGIASINGLRLGLFKGDFENWNEVNASLGASALLLSSILERHKLELEIYPNGSYSTIKELSSGAIWPLHGSTLCNSDFNECSSFDRGISSLLKLIDSTFKRIPGLEPSLPYPIEPKEGSIGGVSANLLFSDRDCWNRAMRMMLINLKWLLVRSSESCR
ncbi:APG6-domain-containing protein [Cryptosporidium felis]|nr:APG6-domain-containing protein [Cryptosporidium felis]